MTPSTAPNALALAASAWQRGCFAEFGAAIIRKRESREKRAAKKRIVSKRHEG